jgi:hypothetical protein
MWAPVQANINEQPWLGHGMLHAFAFTDEFEEVFAGILDAGLHATPFAEPWLHLFSGLVSQLLFVQHTNKLHLSKSWCMSGPDN